MAQYESNPENKEEKYDIYVKGISVADFIQFASSQYRDSILHIQNTDTGKEGLIFFYNGEIVDAELDDLEGTEAALEILAWGKSNIWLQPNYFRKENKIQKHIMALLIDAARIADEKAAKALKEEEDVNVLLNKAISFAQGYHFKEAQDLLSNILKKNKNNIEALLWLSRIVNRMRIVEQCLAYLKRIAPTHPEVMEEIAKFSQVKQYITDDIITHCPFCWAPMNKGDSNCMYCKAITVLSQDSLSSLGQVDEKILRSAIDRYQNVFINEENNFYAFWWMGVANVNLKNFEVGLKYMERAVSINREPYFISQIDSLKEYMESKTSPLPLEMEEEEIEDIENQPKILVVDDSVTTRKTIREILRKAGYNVVEAKDGGEALNKLKTEMPDLVLLDIILPVLDGYKILEIMKAHSKYKEIPVVLLTSQDGFFDKLRAKMSGSNAYVTKPFKPKKLMKVIKKLL